MPETANRLLSEFPIGSTRDSLEVIGSPYRNSEKSLWYIPTRCKCGKLRDVFTCHLRSRHTTSCGCVKTARIRNLNRTHGVYSHPVLGRLRAVHAGMLRRCKADPAYTCKGIGVDSEWRDCSKFISWSLEHGYTPGMELDRIDNAKGYGPENCRFVPSTDNVSNRKNTLSVVYCGKKHPLAALCRAMDRRYEIVYQRIKEYGWSVARAIETPTSKPDYRPIIYMGYRKNDCIFTLGKTGSWYLRRKKLKTEGFRVVGVYPCASSCQVGAVEVILHEWFRARGVTRGVGPKSHGSSNSFETFSKRDVMASGFKFRLDLKRICDQVGHDGSNWDGNNK